jgi:hypothetical protein
MSRYLADRQYNRQWTTANRLWSEFSQRRTDANNTVNASIALLPQATMKSDYQGLLGKKSAATPGAAGGPTQYGGGLVGNQYVPPVQAGINYGGLPSGNTGYGSAGFGYQPPNNYGLIPG